MPEQKRLSLAGIGCGSRTRTYMKLAMEQKNRYRIAAAADPVKQRTEAVRDFAPEEERDSVRLFKDAASLLAEPRLADVAIIGTQDDYHYAPCRKAMELGYHVLLEKPIAKTLKEALELQGCQFKSETDTEVLVQLIEFIKVQNSCSLLDAVREALKQVVGAYAMAVIDKNEPDQIIAARKSSPLVVGIGDDEMFLASDATPFVDHTKNVVYIDDEHIAIIRKGEPLRIVDFENKESKVSVCLLYTSDAADE